jgi:hypothetical protein
VIWHGELYHYAAVIDWKSVSASRTIVFQMRASAYQRGQDSQTAKAFYGASALGGDFGEGTVFQGGTDGSGSEGMNPESGLTPAGNDKALFGTTTFGLGSDPFGTVFRFRDLKLVVLHSFAADGSEGYHAEGPIAVASNGDLFGTACQGSPGAVGTLFLLRPLRAPAP